MALARTAACGLRAPSTSSPLRRQTVAFKALANRAARQAQLSCSCGLLTMPSAGQAYQTSAGPARSAAGAGLRSVSYDELDVQTPLAYELLQGPLARWSHTDATHVPPTAVLVHGILGNRKNMSSFAKMLVEGFPSWQVLLVDLRCHGESAALPGRPEAPHSVASAATDILALLRQLKLFPRVLIGHSFGGKVVMSMVAQFPARLPRPVQVWVLDSLPGQVRAGGGPDGADHPGELIALLRGLAMPVASRNAVMDAVLEAGFSPAIARWVVTNLRPVPGGSPSAGPFSWTFDLDGIADLYSSYESTALWPLLQQPPAGLSLDFVKAERSTFRWGGADEAAIRGSGHNVHLLPNSGHWVHTDNPLGLYDILAPSFGASPDLKQRRTPPGAPGGSAQHY